MPDNNLVTSKVEAAKVELSNDALPMIPQKRYFTIGEVAHLCKLKPHVLRYWEQEFPQLSPSKRRGNRRYYQYKDVVMARQIRSLLYEQGFTINGARQKLSSKDKQEGEPRQAAQAELVIKDTIKNLEEVLAELE